MIERTEVKGDVFIFLIKFNSNVLFTEPKDSGRNPTTTLKHSVTRRQTIIFR